MRLLSTVHVVAVIGIQLAGIMGIGGAISRRAVAQTLSVGSGDQRQLGAHAHGQGKLSIALEKRSVEIELEAPGSDIVGFEHEARTAEQKKAISQARVGLKNGLGLFKPAEAAGCKQVSSKVAVVGGGGHSDHDGHAHGSEKPRAENKPAAASHSEFHVEYTFSCAKPEALKSLQVEYFKSFPAAQSLEVSLIGSSGQTKQTVTRDKSVIVIGDGK